MAATVQFDHVYHGLSPDAGKFRVATSGMAWKGSDSDGVIAMPSAEIKWAQWIRVARNFQLRVGMRDHRKEKFDGFMREDHDKLANLLKNHFGITLETREVALKGWNWGVTDFQGQDLAFVVQDKVAFELPLRHVANSNIAGRTEVSLEFANPSGGSRKGLGDEMVEIRFHVPGTQKSKNTGSDAGSTKSDDEEDDVSAAQVFHDTIKEKAELGQVSGDLILSFEEILVLTPRGRYDMDMSHEYLRLRGKTYDYKILYNSISKLFLLPKDDQRVLFILGLNTPIRQGQTRYQYLVMQFSREEEITAELNMPEEEVAKYDRLKKNYEDPTFEVVSSVFRALAKKKIIGAGSFQSRDGHPGIKANLKAIQGDLFLLEKYIFFVSKSPLLIEIADIHQVVFSRVGASMGAAAARTFDLKITTKSGPEHTFTSINKEEHESVDAYLKDKKIKIKTEMMPDVEMMLAAGGDDDEDDEMQSIDSDDDRGKSKPSKRGGDDEDSEEDEDFEASASDSGSPSDSDSDDSGAATASDASGDLAITEELKKKSKGKGKAAAGGAKKSPKKKAAAKASEGSDADDDDDDRAKPKPKVKAKEEDGMEVDEDKPKPKSKPKPKLKATPGKDGDEAEPPKKKLKTSD
ncbi:FACT complex subunit POB3 [Leucoagaricus sp. SymC.cos]|nr:FACT complex subunit POB3 [Leucoagaricus sp. SymC.cos]